MVYWTSSLGVTQDRAVIGGAIDLRKVRTAELMDIGNDDRQSTEFPSHPSCLPRLGRTGDHEGRWVETTISSSSRRRLSQPSHECMAHARERRSRPLPVAAVAATPATVCVANIGTSQLLGGARKDQCWTAVESHPPGRSRRGVAGRTAARAVLGRTESDASGEAQLGGDGLASVEGLRERSHCCDNLGRVERRTGPSSVPPNVPGVGRGPVSEPTRALTRVHVHDSVRAAVPSPPAHGAPLQRDAALPSFGGAGGRACFFLVQLQCVTVIPYTISQYIPKCEASVTSKQPCLVNYCDLLSFPFFGLIGFGSYTWLLRCD
jgi:hypothetical protein